MADVNETLVVSRWNEATRRMDLVRVPVKSVFGPNDVSDLRTRSLTSKWRNALVREDYSVPRDLVRWPDKQRASGLIRSGYLTGQTSIGTRYPAARAAEALGLAPTGETKDLGELGQVAYVEPAPRRKGRRAVAKATAASRKADAQDRIRPKLDGGGPVVLSDRDMMDALGIKPIGFLE